MRRRASALTGRSSVRAAAPRFPPRSASVPRAGCRWSERARAGGRSAISRAPRASAQDQAAAGRGRARPRRGRTQPGRGRVHPGAAARGGCAKPAATHRRLRRARLSRRRAARRARARGGRRGGARDAAAGRADLRRAPCGRRSPRRAWRQGCWWRWRSGCLWCGPSSCCSGTENSVAGDAARSAAELAGPHRHCRARCGGATAGCSPFRGRTRAVRGWPSGRAQPRRRRPASSGR